MSGSRSNPSDAGADAPPPRSTPHAGASTVGSNFYRAGPALRFVRGALRIAERFAPDFTTGFARRVFCTVLPLKWRQRGAPWRAPWATQRWPFEGGALATHHQSARPAGAAPVALLVHGWGGHARQMRPLAEALARAGFDPVLLDLPGHGHADGWSSNLPQFARAIEQAARRLSRDGAPIALLAAHSLGATASAFAAGRDPLADRLVLIAASAHPRGYFRYFARVFGLRDSTADRMQAGIEAREGVFISDFEAAEAGPRIHAPTMVVHDRADRTNPFADGEALAAAIGGSCLMATEGLGHRRVLDDEAVIERIVAFARESTQAGDAPTHSAGRSPNCDVEMS